MFDLPLRVAISPKLEEKKMEKNEQKKFNFTNSLKKASVNKVYLDGSFATRQCFFNSKFVYYTSAFLVEKNNKEIVKYIEDKTLLRVPKLRHYGNLAELTAAYLAVKWLKENKKQAEVLYSDSRTCVSWLKSAYFNKKKKFATEEHLWLYKYLSENLENSIFPPKSIQWLPREKNKIGIILENMGYE